MTRKLYCDMSVRERAQALRTLTAALEDIERLRELETRKAYVLLQLRDALRAELKKVSRA